MKIPSAALLSFASFVSHLESIPCVASAHSQTLRGTVMSNTKVPRNSSSPLVTIRPDDPTNNNHRVLVANHNVFLPLPCMTCAKGTKTWTSENYDLDEGVTVVPCGVCVTMDHPGDTLVLPHGLDIRGKLTFPDGYRLTLTTPFIRIQGELVMRSTSKVTGKPNVRIVLTGTDEEVTKFVPFGRNKYACSKFAEGTPEKCTVGKKPFVVAGGKVDIRALPRSCPSWVQLKDVIHEPLPNPTSVDEPFAPVPSTSTNSRCDSRLIVSEDFSSGNDGGWTGGYGAFHAIRSSSSNKYLQVTHRKDADIHGPTFDLARVQECLVPNVSYLFSARIRLTKDGVSTGTATSCKISGNNCVKLVSGVDRPTPLGHLWRTKGSVTQTEAPDYGKWHTFHATLVYSDDEVDPDNIFQILRIQGPEPGVDVAIDDVVLTLPPSSDARPGTENGTCSGNMIPNGDAEDNNPYPMDTNDGYISVLEEDDNGIPNKYFRHFGRTNDMHSVVYDLKKSSCILVRGTYKMSAKIRIHSKKPVSSRIEFKTYFVGSEKKDHTAVIASCPPADESGWTTCESEFLVTTDMSPSNDVSIIEKYRIQLETFGSPTADIDLDDLSLQFVQGPASHLILNDPNGAISRCWGKGSEVLITSHTLDYDGGQVRSVKSNPIRDRSVGTVTIPLDETIIPATTLKDSADFAVEVALLSRNVMVEGAKDDYEERGHGGHMMVLQTPDLDQIVEGVEFRNLGQQGNLGRYPIHFHMCNSAANSLLSKNTIRESNQRCVVIHGTHNITISQNVAHDTKGHCYMTEDGSEMDNAFLSNLGSYTRDVAKLISKDESDDFPSTFWCTNPHNEWTGNVAAGSQGSGFWFELLTSPRGPSARLPQYQKLNPRKMALKLFRDNVAHSNAKHGFRTYPHGYLPDVPEGAAFTNTKSYRNQQEGAFLHNSQNLILEGGLYGDNRMQIDLDRAEDITLRNVRVLGRTSLYSTIIERGISGDVSKHGKDGMGAVGVEIHGFASTFERAGATVEGLTFSDFAADGTLILVDDDIRTGHFNYWTTIRNITIDKDPSVAASYVDFTKANAKDITDVYLTDLDSSLRPSGIKRGMTKTSSIVSDSKEMRTFLDPSKCTTFHDLSLAYCVDTCLRTVTHAVSPSGTERYKLKVSDPTDPSIYFEVTGKYYYETLDSTSDDGDELLLDENRNSWVRKSRYFAATLPPGSYLASFLDEDGDEVWPTYVEVTHEDAHCDDALSTGSVQLVVPKATTKECCELIKNGDIEMDDLEYKFWLHHDSGLEVVSGEGIGGSNAIADTIHTTTSGSIGQFLDTRCFSKMKHRQYSVQVWVKLEKSGKVFDCNGGDQCPRIRIRIRTPTDDEGTDYTEHSMMIADQYVATSYKKDKYNLLHGLFYVDDRYEQGSSILLFVERRITNVKMYLDDVSVSVVANDDCNELVFNGGFNSGDSTFWRKDGDDLELTMVGTAESGYSMKITGRKSSSDGPVQDIKVGCLQKGERYLATATVKLFNSNGSKFTCDPTRTSGEMECPELQLRSFQTSPTSRIETHGGYVAKTDHSTTSDGWSTMSGIFTATDIDAAASKIVLSFDELHKSKDFIIDDVSITHLPLDCNQLILNGDGAQGHTPMLWKAWSSNGGGRIEVVQNAGNGSGRAALLNSNRKDSADGMHQFVDDRCLVKDTRWDVYVRMKLVSGSGGSSVGCDPEATNGGSVCPSVRVTGWSGGVKLYDERFNYSGQKNWDAKGFNVFQTRFRVSSQLAKCDKVSFALRNFNSNWDVYVDDFSVLPAGG